MRTCVLCVCLRVVRARVRVCIMCVLFVRVRVDAVGFQGKGRAKYFRNEYQTMWLCGHDFR